MVIEWKEREHSEEDELAMENEGVRAALRNCGLLKFFLTPCLRAQPELLQYLVSIIRGILRSKMGLLIKMYNQNEVYENQ